MEDFQKWIDFLDSKGYSNYYQDLNAKDYGVAQSRNRCFMVSLLGDYTFEFPKPIPLTKTMKDYLDDEVDEKYYINNEKAQKLIDKLIEGGILHNGKESVLLKNMGSSDVDREPDARKTDTATTLLARDYKGLSNYDSNGVIEWK